MSKIKEFLQGKKTYIGAGALALVAVVGWSAGAINVAVAGGMLSAAFAMAGLGAKSDRLAGATLETLAEAKRLVSLRAQGQKIDLAAEEARLIAIVQKAIQGPDALGMSTGTLIPSPQGDDKK